MSRPTVLILDDHALFRNALKAELELHGIDARPCDPRNSESVVEQMPLTGKVDLLYDVNMEPEVWLDRFEVEPTLAKRLRIWVITGMPDVDIAGLREAHPALAIQEFGFDKIGLDAGELAKAIKDHGNHSPLDEWLESENIEASASLQLLLDLYDNFPDPVRLLAPNGRVVWNNLRWATNPQVPATDKRRLEWIIRQHRENPEMRWHETLMWGVLPQRESTDEQRPTLSKGYFRLQEGVFDLEGAQLVLQIQGNAPNLAEMGLREAITQLLDAMRRAGFDGAVYYRVETIPGAKPKQISTRLIQAIGDVQGATTFEARLAKDNFRATIRRLKRRFKNTDQLVVEYRRPEQCQECAVCHEVAHAPGVRDIVEIPIFDASGDELIGLMLCVRKDKRPPQNPPSPTIDEILHWHESYLLGAIQSLHTLIEEEERRLEISTQKQVVVALRRLNSAAGLEQLEKAVLDTAVRLTEASGGLLIRKRPSGDEMMAIRARQGEMQSLLADRIPRVGDMGSIRAFESREIVGEAEFHGSERQRRLLEAGDLEQIVSDPKYAEILRKWVDNGIGSVIAIPLKQGEEVIGALSLQHPEALHFDRHRVAGVSSLMDTAAKLLEAETDHIDRRFKQRELLHRLGGRVKPLKDLFDDFIRVPELRSDQYIREGAEAVKQLTEMIRLLRDADRVWSLDQTFEVDCQDFLVTATKKVRNERSDLHVVEPLLETADNWQFTKLRGERDALLLAYGNLFTNACQHRSGDEPVRVRAEKTDEYWRLFISNPGHIPSEDQQKIFRMDRRGSQAVGRGLGMGLPIARDVAELFGGDVRLEDDGAVSGNVIFLLEWPLEQGHRRSRENER